MEKMEILGREFRVVDKGLDPDEVADLIKAATSSSEDAFQRLEQFSTLQAAALAMDESIAQAKQLAVNTKKQADAEAQQEKQKIIEEARRQALEIIDQARAGGVGFMDNIRSVMIDAIDKALEKAKETTSANLSELSNDIQNEVEARRAQLSSAQEQADVKGADSDNTVSEDKAEKELPKDSELNLNGLRQSLTNLEASLTGLNFNKGPVDRHPESHDADPEPEQKAEKSEEMYSVEETDEEDEPDDPGRRYSGEVVLSIPVGANESWMQQLRRRTLELPGVHIRAESGVDEKTTTVTLSIKEPVELFPVLETLPNVARVVDEETGTEPSGKGGLKLLSKAPKKSKQPTIKIEFMEKSSDVPVG